MTYADTFQAKLNAAIDERGGIPINECLVMAGLVGPFKMTVNSCCGDTFGELTWEDGSTATLSLDDHG